MTQLGAEGAGSGVSWRAKWNIVLLCALYSMLHTVHSQKDGGHKTGKGISEADYYSASIQMILPGYNDSILTHLSYRAGLPQPPFGSRPGQATRSNSCQHIRGVPSELRSSSTMKPNGIANFYQKYTEAYGIPVLSSANVADDALRRACYTTRFLFASHSKVREAFYRLSGRVAVIGRHEETTDIPEHGNLDDYWDTRARGLGATTHAPVSTAGEENVMCDKYPDDPYHAEDIFLHESSHGVHLLGCVYGIAGWDARLQAHYNSAKASGLFANTYSMSTYKELFAENAQAYFNVQSYVAVADGVRGPINTRTKLYDYDRTLYGLIYEVFPCENTYLKRCESTRAQEDAQVLKMDCDLGSGTTSTGGSGTSSGCADQNSNCAAWANNGECTNTPDYMLLNCKKSCNRCPTSGTSSGSCSDDNSNCAAWAGAGECDKNHAYMDTHCRKSCNLCGGGSCADQNQNCQYWSQHGYCTSNQAYMSVNCKASCGTC